MLKKMLLASAAVAAMSASASAADMPIKAPPRAVVAAVYNWSGFYIGGHAGYGWGDVDSTVVTAAGGAFPVGTQFTPTDMDGFIGGGQIGFNYQAGMMVFGIEGEGSWSNINGSSRTNSVAAPGTFVDTDRDLKWLTTVTGRLGIANNNWLFYAKGGWAWAKLTSDSVTTNGAGAVIAISTSSTNRNGYLLGAGVEYGFAPNWSLKIEYNFIDFGTEQGTTTQTSVPGGAVNSVLRDVDAQFHIIKGGINFRFGGMP